MSTAEKSGSIEIPRSLFSRRSEAKALDVSVRMIDYAIASGPLEARRLNRRILVLNSIVTEIVHYLPRAIRLLLLNRKRVPGVLKGALNKNLDKYAYYAAF